MEKRTGFSTAVKKDARGCLGKRLRPVHTLCNNSFPFNSGSYVYGDSTRFQSAAISTDIISTNVKDDFCAVSFSYSASMVELQINVDGLRSVWSSIVVDGDTASRGWVYETASIDLQSVAIQENRELSFDVYMFDVFGEADLDGEVIYFALDNITLHPCIDCSTTTQGMS